MREPVVIVDGRLAGASEPVVDARDQGLLQGVGVFDTMRVERGVALFREGHLRRFFEGLDTLGMGFGPAVHDPWEHACAQVELAVATWGKGDPGSLRITRTWGCTGDDGRTITLVRPLPTTPAEVSVGIAPFAKSAFDPLEHVKGLSRLRNFQARSAAAARGHYDALIPTAEGDLSEGTASNLFAVHSGAVWTPPLRRGCLAGITRDSLLKCLTDMDFKVCIAEVNVDLLAAADEVFLSNSSCGALPVRAVEGVREDLPGARGVIVREVRIRFEREVERYIEDRGVLDTV